MNAPNLPPLPPGYKLAGQFKDYPEQTEVFGLAFDPDHPEDGWVGADTLDMPWTTYQRDDEAVWWLAVQEDSPQALPNSAKAETLAAALEAIIAEMREAAEACYKASNSESDGFASGYARGRMRGIEAYQKKVEQALADYRA